MTSRRPIIGVTGPDRGGGAAWAFTRIAILLAGGQPVLITPRRPREIKCVDGLVIGGGADVNPQLYGDVKEDIVSREKPADEPFYLYLLEWILLPLTWLARTLAGQSSTRGGDAKRDALEMRLIGEAVRRRLPILGICRGAQILNVYFGGTLHQKLAGFYEEDPEVRTILPRKHINVARGSKLESILGTHPQRVNALHRQAINRLGDGLIVAASDRNGIVQAIEHVSLPLVIGVQWHPEYLPQLKEQREIFCRVIEIASRNLKEAPHVRAGLRSAERLSALYVN